MRQSKTRFAPNKALNLTDIPPSASEILQRCDGNTCVADIIETLEKAFDTNGLSKDVHAFLAIAREQHWITLS